MRSIRLPSCLAAFALLFAACDAGPGDGAPPGGASGADGTVDFASIDRSGVSGTLEADHEDDETEVTIQLDGLEPGAAYTAGLFEGRCAAGGVMVVPLGDIDAGSNGSGGLERDVAGTELSPDDPAYVEIQDAAGEAVACADLPGHDRPEQPLTDRLDTIGSPTP